jgi:F-type H+-transporting ATPase subunit b
MFPVVPVYLAAAAMPPGNILSFDKTLLINMGIQAVNIIILTAILAFFLYKPVVKFMNARTERIRGEIEAARGERGEALEMKEKYEKLIAGIETERDDVLHQAFHRAMEKSDQMIFDARREADLLFERKMQELEAEKKKQADDMKRQIIEIAALMAAKIVEINTDQAVHERLIDEAMTEWMEN